MIGGIARFGGQSVTVIVQEKGSSTRENIERNFAMPTGGTSVLEELSAKEKVSGLKQTRRAIAAGRAARVYLACDADPRLTEPLRVLCEQSGVETAEQYSMAQLGRACRIQVGTAAAALLADKP